MSFTLVWIPTLCTTAKGISLIQVFESSTWPCSLECSMTALLYLCFSLDKFIMQLLTSIFKGSSSFPSCTQLLQSPPLPLPQTKKGPGGHYQPTVILDCLFGCFKHHRGTNIGTFLDSKLGCARSEYHSYASRVSTSPHQSIGRRDDYILVYTWES